MECSLPQLKNQPAYVLILRDNPTRRNPGENPQPAVVLKTIGLRRSFGKVRAVDGLDLTVRAGEIYGFLGRNGAGKTTTIRMLMGIIKPEAGTIGLLGTTTTRTTIDQKRRIGYVPQEPAFYPWMSARKLGTFVGGLYPTWDSGEFERLLQLLEIPAERRSSHLSGGTRLKLALALALAHRPALLILDEPTSGLDPVARREFLDIIRDQARRHHRTTFFSTHRIDEVERVADRIGILDKGRLRYEGDIQTMRDSIRRVRLPSDVARNRFPDGGEVLSEEVRNGQSEFILQAPPTLWAEWNDSGIIGDPLSLEDLFLALVGGRAIDV